MKKILAAAGIGAALSAGALMGIGSAQAESFTFAMCPSGNEGVAFGHTSCPFADNVRRAYYASGGSSRVAAWSPVMEQWYGMSCVPGYMAHFSNGQSLIAVRCDGGDDATVVVW